MKTPEKYIEIVQRILRFIEQHDHFLLSGHINADGDAIAAVIATHLFLQKLGKSSVMIFHDKKLDQRFDYLEPFKEVENFEDSESRNHRIESAIILDVPGYKRLGDVCKLLPEKEHIVRIDHHPQEDEMGNLEWIDEIASSTTSMVYEIIEKSGVKIDLELAKAIYTGIVYDTGRFSFSNTNARDLYIGSRMVEIGVNPSEISNIIFFENSIDALRTIGKGLYSIKSYLNGAVAVIYLNHEDMKNSNPHEIEELTNYSVAVRGGKIGLFIREVKPDFHKISLRSKCHVDVNKVAKAFNGGGHARAAGCRIAGKRDEVIEKLVKEIEKHLNHN
ncbi:MAG: bifunctional oligoribonuclease/PAP phosphatase NrnA [Calditrichaeota bacterium]|nr:bifunctional oligoribonuclease/PAP phosphatase NrnA [Calditrichota bacterium]